MEFHIVGFELLEADGGGVSDIHCGYLMYESDAKEWKDRSFGYRSYRPYGKIIRVHESLESLDAFNMQELKEKALAKLTAEERKVLGY